MADMGVKKDEILKVILSLSALAQENAAGTQEASASIEEQTAAIEEIAGSSASLSSLAEEMQAAVAVFKY
jgi:methyl-accepting chemotaxis protein